MKSIVIGLLAHVDAGKTTLSEALLYKSGAIRKHGRVDNRDAFLDTHELEKQRGITIFSKQARMKLGDVEAVLLDTPGHVDFSAETERTLQVLDYAILVISAADGVQAHTKTLWSLLARYNVPVFIFINKMDQEGADKSTVMVQLEKDLEDSCIDFTGFTQGNERDDLFDKLAMCSEEAMEYYLEHGTIKTDMIKDFIRKRKAFPCLFGSALKLSGVDEFLAALENLMRPGDYGNDFAARVYKISRGEDSKRLTFLKVTGGSLKVRSFLGDEKINEIRLYSGERYESCEAAEAGQIIAVTGPLKSQAGQVFGAEQESVLPVLEPVLSYRLILPEGEDPHSTFIKLKDLEEEDPQLKISWDEYSHEINMQLMGEIQTQVMERIIHDRYALNVSFGEGKILYKESIENIVEGVGHFEPLRHYAEVHLRLEPAQRGSGLMFSSECSVNQLDKNWQRLILTHLGEKTHRGVLTGSPITDMNIVLIAGRAHTKHTEGGDFRQATYRAVRQGLMKARSILLEPFFDFTLTVPASKIGRAMTDLERMHGSFSPPETEGDEAVIRGRAPVSTMGSYSTELLAYTGGTGRLQCVPAGYFPCHNSEEVLEEMAYDPEADTENTPDSVFCSHGAGFVVPWYETERYMHLEAAKLMEDEEDRAELRLAEVKEKKNIRADDKELEAIFERTYGPVKTRLHDSTVTIKGTQEKEYVWKERKKKEKQGEYLLVDGYNIIFAWDELKALTEKDVTDARDRLIDILANYQGYTGKNIIIVFDAYKVKGFQGENIRWHNVDIVFTKEFETADQYIEKTANIMSKKYKVSVATSDGTEQVIIRGTGCAILSAGDLKAEIDDVNRRISEEKAMKSSGKGNYVGDYIPK